MREDHYRFETRIRQLNGSDLVGLVVSPSTVNLIQGSHMYSALLL